MNEINKIKKRFLPLDLNFHNDVKFREAAYLANLDNIKFPIFYFIHIFEHYCLIAKKERKNIDVRTISKFSLLETTGLNTEQIETITKYLIKVKLLTKKHTITNYYKWNKNDEEVEVERLSEVEQNNQKLSNLVEKKLSKVELMVEDEVEYLVDKKADIKLYNAWYFQRVTKGLSCRDSYNILISKGYKINTKIITTKPNIKVESVEFNQKVEQKVESVDTPLDNRYKTEENIKEKNKQKENSFEVFWKQYGSLGSKKAAENEFNKAIKDENPENIISGIEGLEWYCEQNPWYKKPNASTWLKGEGWHDDRFKKPSSIKELGIYATERFIISDEEKQKIQDAKEKTTKESNLIKSEVLSKMKEEESKQIKRWIDDKVTFKRMENGQIAISSSQSNTMFLKAKLSSILSSYGVIFG